jgi:hypothetical protein
MSRQSSLVRWIEPSGLVGTVLGKLVRAAPAYLKRRQLARLISQMKFMVCREVLNVQNNETKIVAAI